MSTKNIHAQTIEHVTRSNSFLGQMSRLPQLANAAQSLWTESGLPTHCDHFAMHANIEPLGHTPEINVTPIHLT